MTVSSENSKAGPYTGNGVQEEFSYSFKVFSADEIRVVITDTDGVDTDADPEDFTVDGIGEDEGTVTYNNGAPLPTGYKLTILRNMDFTQKTDISNNGAFYPEILERVSDRLTMMVQQVKEENERAIKISPSDTETDPDTLITAAQTAATQAENARDDILNDAGFIAVAADLTGADTIGTVADDLTGDNNIGTVADNIAAVIAAPGAAAAAADSADEAAESAAAAAASEANINAVIDAAMFRDVVFITSANSPYTVTQAQSGKLISVDTSGGAVAITLPEISTLDLPFTLGVKKTTSDGNSVTISRSGSDTIEGSPTKGLSSAGAGTTLIPDTDTTPDTWSTADFGAVAGNITVDAFTGDGVRTTDTLSVAPGSKNNTTVIIGGVVQLKSSYEISGTTITYDAAPTNGAEIEVWSGSLLPIGTPADGSVTEPKINSGAVTTGKLTDKAVTPAKIGSGAATAGQVMTADGSGGAAFQTLVSALSVARLTYTVAANTAGYALTSGAFRTIPVNTEDFDPNGIVSLSSNQFTLAAGTYTIQCFAEVNYGTSNNNTKARLYNVTDGVDVLLGSTTFATPNQGTGVPCVVGAFTIGAGKALEFQVRVSANTTAMAASNFGVSEVYTQILITKVG